MTTADPRQHRRRRQREPESVQPVIHRCTALLMLGRFEDGGINLHSALDVLCKKWDDNHDPVDQHTGSVQGYDNDRKQIIMVDIQWPR